MLDRKTHAVIDWTHFSTPAQVKDKRSDFTTRDPRIRQALEIIEMSYPVEIGPIASKLNLSDSRFRHLFKKELGMSPSHCIMLLRLRRAKELLESSFLRVKEVAALVGATDISHFVRSYKMLYGQTPSQTRNVSPGARVTELAVGEIVRKRPSRPINSH